MQIYMIYVVLSKQGMKKKHIHFAILCDRQQTTTPALIV